MPIVYVTRRVHFNAAHRLHNPNQSDSWNSETFGKCNLPNWHGHNYIIEVTVAGTPDPDTGYVIDLGVLKNLLREKILDPCDHRNLNMDVPFLSGIIPSAENLAIAFWNQLNHTLPAGELYAVKVFETERNIAEYRGE